MRPFIWHKGEETPVVTDADYILQVWMLYSGHKCETYCVAQWNGYGWAGDTGADLRAVDMDSVIEVIRWAVIPQPDEAECAETEIRARRDSAVLRLGTLVGIYRGKDEDILAKWAVQARSKSVWALEEALYHLAVIIDAERSLGGGIEPWDTLRHSIITELEARRHGS